MTDRREPQHESPRGQPDVGSILGGRFRILRRIGEGGMGVVLEAENTLTGKRVAIKWMHPEMAAQADAAQRMVREARASARVRHPNVVDVYDVVEEGGAIFLVMELLDGEPLTALLERGQTPPHTTIGLVLDAMRGVAAAHREGVIHRDVKPDNIFLSREPDRPHPIAKVLDFGISKLTDREGLSLTRTGMTLGTPMYMSYEQLAGVRDIDFRADVYAFGVILYEALTGQAPFVAETFSELIIKITTTQAPTPKSLRPALPLALSTIVQRAMARDRNDRTPSLEVLIAELDPFSTAEGFQARVTQAAAEPFGSTIVAPITGDEVVASAALAASTASTASAAQLPSRVHQPAPGTGSTPFAQSFDLDDGRISIPRTFSWKSTMLWGGLALAVAAAISWFASSRSSAPTDAPHLVTPASQPHAAAQPEAPAPPSPANEPNEPNAPNVEPPVTAPSTAASAKPRATATDRAQKTASVEPAKPARQKPDRKRATPSEEATKPAATPTKPAATLRAGRPRSQDF